MLYVANFKNTGFKSIQFSFKTKSLNRFINKMTTKKESEKKTDDPCWKGYEQVGMKTKGGKKVPNCVPENKAK